MSMQLAHAVSVAKRKGVKIAHNPSGGWDVFIVGEEPIHFSSVQELLSFIQEY